THGPGAHATLLARVDAAIGVNDRELAFAARSGVFVFHPYDARVPLGVKMLEDIGVVDLAAARFGAAGVAGALQVGNFAPTAVDVPEEIAFGDLLMVHVEEDLTRRVIDRAAQREGMRRLGEE